MIIATISDCNCCSSYIKSLHRAGTTLFRLNTAHQDTYSTRNLVAAIRYACPGVPIMIDTKGPEVRTCNESFTFSTGESIEICPIFTSYRNFPNEIPLEQRILIDDGEIELIATHRGNDSMWCEVIHGGVLKPRSSVNVPGCSLKIPMLSIKDIDYLSLAVELNIEYIAHSFVRSANDAIQIREYMPPNAKLISKIEDQEGLDNIWEILPYSDVIMVARGDLGVEIGLESVPGAQSMIAGACRDSVKPFIVATQLLHGMIKNPKPTRAEAGDIYQAIEQGASWLMLSGETTHGKYPVECVEFMKKMVDLYRK